jgi:hypothetical protein
MVGGVDNGQIFQGPLKMILEGDFWGSPLCGYDCISVRLQHAPFPLPKVQDLFCWIISMIQWQQYGSFFI